MENIATSKKIDTQHCEFCGIQLKVIPILFSRTFSEHNEYFASKSNLRCSCGSEGWIEIKLSKPKPKPQPDLTVAPLIPKKKSFMEMVLQKMRGERDAD